MADIFISYASEDESRVSSLAKALEDCGWSVWWDRSIPPGKTFTQVIKEAIGKTGCVVVLWSDRSIKSEWVQEEATIGKKRKILVPAKIDPVDPPLGFTMIQAADLTDWTGDVSHTGFTGLIGAISEIVGTPKQKKVPDRPEAESIQDTEPPHKNAEEIKRRKAEHLLSDKVIEKPPLKEKKPAEIDKRSIGRKILVPVFAVVTLLFCLAAVVWIYLPSNIPETVTNSIGMKFALIPAGSFTMGSPESEKGRGSDETQHPVTLTRPFYMQTTEVTQGQWQKVVGDNRLYFKGCDDCAVDNVSWKEAQGFIARLNAKEGTTYYRLPTEAEWEYAARAGSTTAFSFGDDVKELDEYAWYENNYNREVHPVGTRKPNAWGLYDMHGSVWEWVEDWYGFYPTESVADPEGPLSDSHRVIRGGSRGNYWHFCRSAGRFDKLPDDRKFRPGFRLAKSVTLGP